MSLSELGFKDQPFDHLYLLPIGAELPVGLSSKSLLHQLNSTFKKLMTVLSTDELQLIAKLTQLPIGVFPIAVVADQIAYPYLIQPDYFLRKRTKQGLHLTPKTTHFDDKNLAKLSPNQFDSYCAEQLSRYAFAGKLVSLTKKQWKERAQVAYTQHPFIQLASNKRLIIEAVERLNRSMLLGVLNPPEDVAFWRHRVEIVLRPYRSLPPDARYHACNHAITLTISKNYPSFQVNCEACAMNYDYFPMEDRVALQQEVPFEQAVKRIATIERQFDALAEGTPKVITALQKLHTIQQWFPHNSLYENQGPVHRLVASISAAEFPDTPVEPSLLSLQHVKLSTIDSLRLVQPYLATTQEELQQLLENERAEELSTDNQDASNEVVYFSTKGYTLYENEVDVIEEYLSRDEGMTFHLLIQVLKGEATSKVRSLNLHLSPIFGLLRPWPKKLIPQAIKSFW